MPFYVSPEQSMRDKADYARKGIARGRSCVALQYAGGILLVAPNPSSALHKISEIYDRIGFAAVGRYNEYENLRKAGVTYADITGYQFDRHDVTARGIANWYAQTLGTIFTESPKPFEVEIVVAEVGVSPADDQIYRITFDGSVTDEPGFVAFGGQADQVSAALKERSSDDMSLSEAFAAALSALSAPGNGERTERTEFAAAQLEVAILDRARDHRTFRRIRAARLEELLAGARPAPADETPAAESSAAETPADESSADESSAAETPADESSAEPSGSAPSGTGPGSSTPPSSTGPSSPSSPSDPEPPTGPAPGGSDRGTGLSGGSPL
jgi:proteasome alpha subunit